MQTTAGNRLLGPVLALLLVGGTVQAIELVIHEDSAVRLDFSVDWSQLGDTDCLYRRGEAAPGGWPPYNTLVEAEEHLPLVAVRVLSREFPESGSQAFLDELFFVWCHWTGSEPYRGRVFDSISRPPPWYRINPDGQSGRFVYGLAPAVPDGGSTLCLAVCGLAAFGWWRRRRAGCGPGCCSP